MARQDRFDDLPCFRA